VLCGAVVEGALRVVPVLATVVVHKGTVAVVAIARRIVGDVSSGVVCESAVAIVAEFIVAAAEGVATGIVHEDEITAVVVVAKAGDADYWEVDVGSDGKAGDDGVCLKRWGIVGGRHGSFPHSHKLLANISEFREVCTYIIAISAAGVLEFASQIDKE
jgi:hypothetical protein